MLAVLIVAVLAGGGLAVAFGLRRPDEPLRDAAARAVGRRTLRYRAAGVVLGLVVGLEVQSSG